MASHKSAEKRARRNTRRQTINRRRRSRTHTAVVKLEAALAAKDGAKTKDALRAAEGELSRAAHKGALSKKRAARKVSRLAARTKAMKSK